MERDAGPNRNRYQHQIHRHLEIHVSRTVVVLGGSQMACPHLCLSLVCHCAMASCLVHVLSRRIYIVSGIIFDTDDIITWYDLRLPHCR